MGSKYFNVIIFIFLEYFTAFNKKNSTFQHRKQSTTTNTSFIHVKYMNVFIFIVNMLFQLRVL